MYNICCRPFVLSLSLINSPFIDRARHFDADWIQADAERNSVCSPLRCTSIFHHCVFFIIFVVVFTRIRAALARLLWFDESADEPSCCNTRWLQYSAHLYYSSESHCRVSGEHKCIAAHCASRGTAEVLHYSYCTVHSIQNASMACLNSWHNVVVRGIGVAWYLIANTTRIL